MDFTPDTEVIRERYILFDNAPEWLLATGRSIRGPEFDRWLNEERAKAWDTGVESEADEHGHRHLPESANPYRKADS